MGLFQAIPESFSILQILLLCFTPLLPFLCFELINNFKNDNDDDDFDGGMNILATQSQKYSQHHEQIESPKMICKPTKKYDFSDIPTLIIA